MPDSGMHQPLHKKKPKVESSKEDARFLCIQALVPCDKLTYLMADLEEEDFVFVNLVQSIPANREILTTETFFRSAY